MTDAVEPRSFAEMERVYDQLAAAIDRAGPDGEVLLLTRLAMVLAHRAGSSIDFTACIAAANGAGEPRRVAAP